MIRLGKTIARIVIWIMMFAFPLCIIANIIGLALAVMFEK